MSKKLPEGIAARNRLFYYYKKGAKRKNLEFELTIEQFERLTKSNCFYCGVKPSNSMLNEVIKKRMNGDYIYNGIDRVDNTRGYVIDNVIPCCSKCNYMKNSSEVSEFLEHILKIAKHHKLSGEK